MYVFDMIFIVFCKSIVVSANKIHIPGATRGHLSSEKKKFLISQIIASHPLK
jgi:hypothetical protein